MKEVVYNRGGGQGGSVAQDGVSGGLTQQDVNTVKKLVDDRKFQERSYYNRTVMISHIRYNQPRKRTHYLEAKTRTRFLGLMFLWDSAEKFYITATGTLRFTFKTAREAVMNVLESKRIFQVLNIRHAHVQIMTAPEDLQKKKDLLSAGKYLKEEGSISSYNVVNARCDDGTYKIKLRTWSRDEGVKFIWREKTGPGEDDYEVYWQYGVGSSRPGVVVKYQREGGEPIEVDLNMS